MWAGVCSSVPHSHETVSESTILHFILHVSCAFQFREQRLKTCQLKRDMFQLHFSPQSDPNPSRKRPEHPEADGEDSDRPPPAKQSRGEGGGSDTEMKTEQQEGEEQSSSSESVDELPMHFQSRDIAKRGHHGVASTSKQSSTVTGLTTGVMENIVSSSGMEADIGAERVQVSAGETAEGAPSPAAPLEPTRTSKTPTEDIPSITIKQESDSNDADFAHAFSGNTAASGGQGPPDHGEDNPAFSSTGENLAAGVTVKQEVEDFPADPCNTSFNVSAERQHEHDAQHSSRPTSSPPLSHIRVETLQRQFEESFGAHLTSSAASLDFDSSHPLQEPHPVQLITAQKDPEMVENFLIDTHLSEASSLVGSDSQLLVDEGQGSSTPSMLRHLLTRPRQQAADGQESSSYAGRADRAAEASQSSQDSQQSGAGLEANIKTPSTPQRHTENFLLTPGKDGFQDRREDRSTFVKQEPEENADDYSHALIASFGSSEQQNEKESVRLGSREKQWNARSQNRQRTSFLTRQAKQREASTPPRNTQKNSVLGLSPSEKLKSYSNMSLRDLLTMKTEINHSPFRERSTGESAREGDVVWECGFCHFEHHSKSVVLTHRQQHHAQHMAEAGLRDDEGEGEKWAASSADGDDLAEFREEDGGRESWRDQPSTSGASGQVWPQSLSSPWAGRYSSQAEALSRSSRARGIRRDDDFDYMSDDSVVSSSGSEPEDLEDKNYVPPKNLSLQEIVSSEEEEESGEEKQVKKVAVMVKKRRGRPPKNRNKIPEDRKDGQRDSSLWVKRSNELYLCPYCDHPPSSLPVLKDHIRHTANKTHLLVVRRAEMAEGQRYICPGEKCSEMESYDPQESRRYLVHVLQCQGHILDAHKPSTQAVALTLLDKVGRVAGFLNCPISNCYFVSYFKEQMRVHLEYHVQRLHRSQMLLFRSVCTVMAKTYASVSGFDRYICYQCSSIVVDLGQVMNHVQKEHEGKVRGVLHVTQRLEGKSRGIIVAVQCLKCLQRVPSLDQWFGHSCQVTGQQASEKDAAWSSLVGKYKPTPCVPAFDEWLWRISNTSIKVAPPVSAANKSETDGDKQRPLPLIRSILLAQPTPATEKQAGTAEGESATKTARVEKRRENDSDDDVTPMVECEDCQDFVLETAWKHHKCFVEAQKKLSKDSEKSSQHSPSPSVSTASSKAASSSEDTPVSHSRLLAALATRHQTEPSASTAVRSGPTPKTSTVSSSSSSSSSTTHPSLVSLLTRSQNQPTTTKSGSEESETRSDPQPPRKDGGMIRSLLSRSLASPEARKEVTDKGGQQAPQGDSDVAVTSHSQPHEPKTPSTATAASDAGGTEAGSKWSGSASSILQKLVGERSGTGQGSSSRSSSAFAQPQQPLMNFLRQQGDQVMQVLGNVLDDREAPS